MKGAPKTSTTLKLPNSLRRRVAPLARARSQSSHSWMVDALTAQVSLAERRAAFVASAVESAAEVDDTGIVYGAEDVFGWLRARVKGKRRGRPQPKHVKR